MNRPERPKGAWKIAFASLLLRSIASADLPRPLQGPTLPELSHPHANISIEHAFAAVALEGTQAKQTSVSTHRLSFDLPLVPRRWYVTGAWSFVVGKESGTTVAATNTELGIRGVWASITGIAMGGGISIIAPTSSVSKSGPASLVLGEAATARPWDRPMFEPDTFAFRPYVDVRTTAGRFSGQFRQMLDMVAAGSNTIPFVDDYRLAAVAILFVGFHVTDSFGVGLEVAERYDLSNTQVEGSRPRFSLTASLRYRTRWLEPSIAVTGALGSPINAFSTVGAPIDRAPASYVGIRLGFDITGFDPPWGKVP